MNGGQVDILNFFEKITTPKNYVIRIRWNKQLEFYERIEQAFAPIGLSP